MTKVSAARIFKGAGPPSGPHRPADRGAGPVPTSRVGEVELCRIQRPSSTRVRAKESDELSASQPRHPFLYHPLMKEQSRRGMWVPLPRPIDRPKPTVLEGASQSSKRGAEAEASTPSDHVFRGGQPFASPSADHRLAIAPNERGSEGTQTASVPRRAESDERGPTEQAVRAT